MPHNFIESTREQGFLLPPDVRDWLPADHLAWFVIDAVAAMDLASFYAVYRSDGHGRAAYEPSVMVTLVLYSVATGVRSSRQIESHCRQDVAFRVITGNLVPDHATISRFICRHERALADLFNAVLRLCDEAGLVRPGLVAVDGTRVAGNARTRTAPGCLSRSRWRSSPSCARPMRLRTGSMAMSVVMSCRSGCAPRRAAVSSSLTRSAGCALIRNLGSSSLRMNRKLAGWSSALMSSGSCHARRGGRGGGVRRAGSLSDTAGLTPIRFRAHARSGC